MRQPPKPVADQAVRGPEEVARGRSGADRTAAAGMRIESLELADLPNQQLCVDLISAWAIDDKQWGTTLNAMLTRHSLRNTMVAVSTGDWRFTWVGPGLVFLDPEPDRLYGRPVETIADRQFLNGVMQDLQRATAQARPTISRIITPLNNRIVEYNLLSLPDWERRDDRITGCLRIPFDLIVYGEAPDQFNPRLSVPNTFFSSGAPPIRST